jgi:hypothetical protein
VKDPFYYYPVIHVIAFSKYPLRMRFSERSFIYLFVVCATRFSHPIILDLIASRTLSEKVQIVKPLVVFFPPTIVVSFMVGPRTLITLSSPCFSLCYSPRVRDQLHILIK